MTLYVSDLDGTLLNNNALISANSINLLNNAISNNAQFTVATARTPATVVNILKNVDIKLPIITMNGSAIYDIANAKYLYHISLDKLSIMSIQNLIASENLNAFIYTINNNHLAVYHNELTNPYQIQFYEERKNSPYKTFIQSTLPNDCEVLYFTIMDAECKVNSLYEKLKNISDLSIVKYKDTYNKDIMNLEIYHKSSSKANAINYLKNSFHFDKLICFGDNLNDIPMFNISDECYSVKNAVPELKKISTGVIDSNIDDSVAKFIFNNSK